MPSRWCSTVVGFRMLVTRASLHLREFADQEGSGRHAGARGELSRPCPGREAVPGSALSADVQLGGQAAGTVVAGSARAGRGDGGWGGAGTHFIGSVVIAPSPTLQAGGVNRWLLVDGQQRLTTLMLALAAIRDHWAAKRR